MKDPEQNSIDRKGRSRTMSRTRRTGKTGHTGQSRQHSADRTAQTEDNKQVRTNRVRKTGSAKLNDTIGTLLYRKQWVVKYKYFIL